LFTFNVLSFNESIRVISPNPWSHSLKPALLLRLALGFEQESASLGKSPQEEQSTSADFLRHCISDLQTDNAQL
jgi:hypothetical protein